VLDELQTRRLITSPSLGAVTYQAQFLVHQLQCMNDEEYPTREAQRIRDVFLCLAEYLADQLAQLQSKHDLLPEGDDLLLLRVMHLAEMVEELYSYLRYIRASTPVQTLPGLQVALTQLTQLHFPGAADDYLCLVRPQWKYNLTCVLLTSHLRNQIPISVLDPEGDLGVDTPDALLSKLWVRRRDKLPKEKRGDLPATPPSRFFSRGV